eukprot:Pgem_evm2s19181
MLLVRGINCQRLFFDSRRGCHFFDFLCAVGYSFTGGLFIVLICHLPIYGIVITVAFLAFNSSEAKLARLQKHIENSNDRTVDRNNVVYGLATRYTFKGKVKKDRRELNSYVI